MLKPILSTAAWAVVSIEIFEIATFEITLKSENLVNLSSLCIYM